MNTIVNKSIFAEEVVIGDIVELGVGEEVKVVKNTAKSGVTTVEDYPDGLLPSGGIIIKAGEVE